MSLKHSILGFLSITPLTGYDLKKAFDSSVRHFWYADQSQIYRTLSQIVDEGWATVETIPQQERPNRKVYTITASGRAELLQWLRSPLPPREEHDPLLVQLFFASQLPDSEVIALLEREHALAQAQLSQLEAIARDYPKAQSRQQAFALLTLDYGLRMHKSHVAWIEELLARLQSKQGLSDLPEQSLPKEAKE